jgi:antibiotic biosynthesis monooxygenase (ABM) superfamily enzyme
VPPPSGHGATSKDRSREQIMPSIEAGNGIVTHINVFTVAPERQNELVKSLIDTVKAAREMPGWISASIHRSLDGRQVTNYVQFESREAAQRVTQRLLAMGLIQRNTAIGTVSPGQYEVAFTLARE